MRRLKEKLYFLKVWWQILFAYPQRTLDPQGLRYDAYWKDKRGSAVGALSDWQKARADLIRRLIEGKDPISLGDIGCGGGSTLEYLGRHLRVTERTGYDISAVALEQVEASGSKAVALDVGNRDDLGRIEEADYLLLLEVLEHVPHAEQVLAVAYAKAHQGVFFSFPNSGFFIYRLRLLFGKFPMQWRVHPSEHVRFWTLRDLRWWLKAQGYGTYKISCYKGVPFLNAAWPSLFAAGLFVYLPRR